MNVEKIVTLTDDEYYYTAGYYVTNKWIDNETFIGVRSTEETIRKSNELIKVSLSDMSIEILDNDIRDAGFTTVFNNKVYYSVKNGIFFFFLGSREKRLICETDASALQMTADGKFASVFVENDEPNRFYRINIETGEIEKLFEKSFKKPFNVANHFMISPTDKDMFFFAHEPKLNKNCAFMLMVAAFFCFPV